MPLTLPAAMLVGSAGAAAANVTGGLFSGAANRKFNAREAQKARDFQVEMYNRQLSDQRAMIADERAYTDISSVMSRAAKAGVNRSFAATGTTGSSAPRISQGVPSGVSAPTASNSSTSFQVGSIPNLGEAWVQGKQAEANTRLTLSQALSTDLGNVASGGDSAGAYRLLDLKIDILKNQGGLSAAQIEQSRAQVTAMFEQIHLGYLQYQASQRGLDIASLRLDLDKSIADRKLNIDQFNSLTSRITANADALNKEYVNLYLGQQHTTEGFKQQALELQSDYQRIVNSYAGALSDAQKSFLEAQISEIKFNISRGDWRLVNQSIQSLGVAIGAITKFGVGAPSQSPQAPSYPFSQPTFSTSYGTP